MKRVIESERLSLIIQEQFKEILQGISGEKLIVMSKEIRGKLTYAIPNSIIKKYQVQQYILLENNTFQTIFKNIIYLVSPKPHYMQWIAKQIHYIGTENAKFYIYMVPRRTLMCERMLRTYYNQEEQKKLRNFKKKEEGEEEGEEDYMQEAFVNVDEFPMDLLPFEDDLFSMEEYGSFKDLFMDSDLTCLSHVARALVIFQAQYGVIPEIRAKGELSVACANILRRNTYQQLIDRRKYRIPSIDMVLFIDRSLDMVSPFLTPFTYEGLIDELFGGIERGVFKANFLPLIKTLSEENVNNDSTIHPTPQKVMLNSKDQTFKALRDVNKRFFKQKIKDQTDWINSLIAQKDGKDTVKELGYFVKNLLEQIPRNKLRLSVHVRISEQINNVLRTKNFAQKKLIEQVLYHGVGGKEVFEYIQDSIYQMDPMIKSLKLMCIYSYIFDGIATKKYEKIKQDMVNTYGFEASIVLANLVEAELIKIRKGSGIVGFVVGKKDEDSTKWNTIVQQFGLLHKDVDVWSKKPLGLHQIYEGFAPYSLAIIRLLSRKWEAHKKIFTPSMNAEDIPGYNFKYPELENIIPKDRAMEKKNVLVFMIGGITYGEINALRNLSLADGYYNYIAATTRIVNGRELLFPFFDDEEHSDASPQSLLVKEKLRWEEEFRMKNPNIPGPGVQKREKISKVADSEGEGEGEGESSESEGESGEGDHNE